MLYDAKNLHGYQCAFLLCSKAFAFLSSYCAGIQFSLQNECETNLHSGSGDLKFDLMILKVYVICHTYIEINPSRPLLAFLFLQDCVIQHYNHNDFKIIKTYRTYTTNPLLQSWYLLGK